MNIVFDFRIPGIPHSAVGQVETNREEKVRRLIDQFESHRNRIMLLKDYKKSEEINQFSQESKDWINEMGSNVRLRLKLGNRYGKLHMRKMLAAYDDGSTI